MEFQVPKYSYVAQTERVIIMRRSTIPEPMLEEFNETLKRHFLDLVDSYKLLNPALFEDEENIYDSIFQEAFDEIVIDYLEADDDDPCEVDDYLDEEFDVEFEEETGSRVVLVKE